MKKVLFIFVLFALCISMPIAIQPQSTDWQTLIGQSQQFLKQKKYDLAIAASKQALEIAKKIPGENNINLITSLNCLSDSYCGKGQFDNAIPYSERVLTIYEKKYGEDSTELIIPLRKLAYTYME